jgi:hypothetical protein
MKKKMYLFVIDNKVLIDKFGTIVTVILTCFKHKNDLIKKSIKKI